jgi:hypothetical protein
LRAIELRATLILLVLSLGWLMPQLCVFALFGPPVMTGAIEIWTLICSYISYKVLLGPVVIVSFSFFAASITKRWELDSCQNAFLSIRPSAHLFHACRFVCTTENNKLYQRPLLVMKHKSVYDEELGRSTYAA